MSELPEYYSGSRLNYVAKYKPVIEDTIFKLSQTVSLPSDINWVAASAGFISEEYHDARDTTGVPLERTVIDLNAKGYNHKTLLESYNILENNPELWDPLDDGLRIDKKFQFKRTYPSSWDLGDASIQIHTAIDLLNDYMEQHPDDPLKISHYDVLVDDLTSSGHPISGIMSTLMVVKGAQWYEDHIDNWNDLTSSEKEGLLSYFANTGERKRDKAYQAAVDQYVEEQGLEPLDPGIVPPDFTYEINPYATDIALEYLLNQDQLLRALNEPLPPGVEVFLDQRDPAGIFFDLSSVDLSQFNSANAEDVFLDFDINSSLTAENNYVSVTESFDPNFDYNFEFSGIGSDGAPIDPSASVNLSFSAPLEVIGSGEISSAFVDFENNTLALFGVTAGQDFTSINFSDFDNDAQIDVYEQKIVIDSGAIVTASHAIGNDNIHTEHHIVPYSASNSDGFPAIASVPQGGTVSRSSADAALGDWHTTVQRAHQIDTDLALVGEVRKIKPCVHRFTTSTINSNYNKFPFSLAILKSCDRNYKSIPSHYVGNT